MAYQLGFILIQNKLSIKERAYWYEPITKQTDFTKL
jgi:hypothetical protein